MGWMRTTERIAIAAIARWLIPVRPLAALVMVKNPNAPAVKREAEEDWGR